MRSSRHSGVLPLLRRGVRAAAFLVVALCAQQGCGPSGHYNRSFLTDDRDSGAMAEDANHDRADAGPVGSGGAPPTGGTGHPGTGGMGTGGISGTGGTAPGSGGASPGTGGAASGGISGGGTGGRSGSGGAGTGGAGTGGAATGGAASGGRGSGGAGTGGAGTGGAGPRVVSIDFVGGATPMGATDVAGVKPAAHWNSASGMSGSLSALKEKDGAATTAAVTWTAGGVWQIAWADPAGDTRMMSGYLDPLTAAAPASVSVSGLAPEVIAGGYDVYVYSYSSFPSGTRNFSYSIGATTITASQTGPSATAFTSYTMAANGGTGNYVLFRKVMGSSFTLTATPGNASGTQTRAPVNGIQIVYPSGS